MAAYHTPITLTRTRQTVGPFADKVTIQPQGGAIFITDTGAPAGTVGLKVLEGEFFDIPASSTAYVWHTGRSGTLLVMMKALV